MSHYAKITNGIVEQVIRSEKEFIENLDGEWIQTSYNGSIRKNYAGIGFTYNTELDAFIPPQTYASWILNEDTCKWEAPVPYPADSNEYIWNEETQSWELIDV
tara:strand:- start:44 stop:352 length:309 start_codon:yes stop_codon:yes gene_type:complete